MMSKPGNWLMLADLTLIIHAVFVLFVVGGQIAIVAGCSLGWLWTRQLVFRLLAARLVGLLQLRFELRHAPVLQF